MSTAIDRRLNTLTYSLEEPYASQIIATSRHCYTRPHFGRSRAAFFESFLRGNKVARHRRGCRRRRSLFAPLLWLERTTFAEAVAAAIRPADILANAKSNLADTLAGQFFARDAARSRADVDPLDIVIRFLTGPDASRVLRDFVQNDFIEPFAKTLKQPSNSRRMLSNQ